MAAGDTNFTNVVLSGNLTVAGTVTSREAPWQFVAGGSTLSATAALHAGKLIQLDTATGTVVTLPTPTGSGAVYGFVTTVIATSNSHVVKVAGATDYFTGALIVVDDAAGSATVFATTGSTTTRSDTITLNRSTTGSVAIGELFFLTDIKAGYFSVSGVVVATGAEATPFSATV